MDDIIKKIQTYLADGMHSLPVLFMSFPFFTGVLTANTGMLLLSILLILGVNGLVFMLNIKPFEENKGWTLARLFFSVFVLFLFRFSVPYKPNVEEGSTKDFLQLIGFGNTGPAVNEEAGATKDVLLSLGVILYSVHVIFRFFFQTMFEKKTTGGDCSILSRGPAEHDNPSLWLVSVTYFIGFVFANAFSIFNLPTPVVEGNQLDEKQKQIQQKAVNDRVMNRKITTSLVMLSSLAFLAFALWYRLTKTNCEQSFGSLVIPLSFTFITSFFLYYYIVIKCGIRAPDVLGITYDMIHPDMVNKPIVCVTK